jgi:hypothetical protein
MTKIILGNANNLSVSDDNSNGDTIIVGNGTNDIVSANNSQNDIITLGTGAGDMVTAAAGPVSQDFITLGSGAGDAVNIAGSTGPEGQGSIITLGSGAGDTVNVSGFFINGYIITLGNGAGAIVNVAESFDSSNNTITLGNGAGDTVYGGGNGNGGSSSDTIILGGGNNDTVFVGGQRGAFGDTITLGNGAGDTVSCFGLNSSTITLGNGNYDTVLMKVASRGVSNTGCTITVGNGNGDVVNDFQGNFSANNAITVGNGNDTIYVGNSDTITVGTGQDSFIFQQTAGEPIGAVTINGFNPSKDRITLSNQLTTSVTYQDNAQGNAVVTVDSARDTITLVGVHSSALVPSDFQFADPPAANVSNTAPSPNVTDQVAQLTQAMASFSPTDLGSGTGPISQTNNDVFGVTNQLASPHQPHA